MTCPNCGAAYDAGCRFCGACGTPLVSNKKGTHRVPILIMLFLTVLGLWVFFATGSPAADVVPTQPVSDTPWFTARSGSLLFDKYMYNGPSELVVPAAVDGETVVRIEDGCFEDCDVLTVVTLPDSVEHIGLDAFADCDALRALDLPPALTSIGTGAFAGCDRLEAVHVPASVHYIGWDAFNDCDSLAYIFYDGTLAQWEAIYHQDLETETMICCTDGNYFQAE